MQSYFESPEWKQISYWDRILHQAVNRSLDMTMNKLGRNDFEMNLLMLQQKRLYLVQCLNSINRKDLVKEFDIAIRIVLKSLLVDLFE